MTGRMAAGALLVVALGGLVSAQGPAAGRTNPARQAASVAAGPMFMQALAEAKKDHKTLFLWFSAPW